MVITIDHYYPNIVKPLIKIQKLNENEYFFSNEEQFSGIIKKKKIDNDKKSFQLILEEEMPQLRTFKSIGWLLLFLKDLGFPEYEFKPIFPYHAKINQQKYTDTFENNGKIVFFSYLSQFEIEFRKKYFVVNKKIIANIDKKGEIDSQIFTSSDTFKEYLRLHSLLDRKSIMMLIKKCK